MDVGYSRSNVKIVGVSGGVSYGALGSTHHAAQDIALLRAVPGLEIFLPADAVQTALLRAWDRRSRFRAGTNLEAWLYKLAYHACIDLLRQRRRQLFAPFLRAAEDAPAGSPRQIISRVRIGFQDL